MSERNRTYREPVNHITTRVFQFSDLFNGRQPHNTLSLLYFCLSHGLPSGPVLEKIVQGSFKNVDSNNNGFIERFEFDTLVIVADADSELTFCSFFSSTDIEFNSSVIKVLKRVELTLGPSQLPNIQSVALLSWACIHKASKVNVKLK